MRIDAMCSCPDTQRICFDVVAVATISVCCPQIKEIDRVSLRVSSVMMKSTNATRRYHALNRIRNRITDALRDNIETRLQIGF